jgi:hypothetical protein
MNAFEAGKKWGESVNGGARSELLKRAATADSASALKRALGEVDRDLPSQGYEPFQIRDWSSVDADWIASFCEGVRSTRTESRWG